MKLKVLVWAFLALSIIGCSTDDNINVEPEQIQKASFKVIGEDSDSVYLFSYNGFSETTITENLTEELGVQPDYLTLRQLDNLLSFYSFSQGAFSLTQKNIATNTSSSFENFYINDANIRSIVWGINDINNVFFGYFTPSGARNLAIQNIDLSGSQSEDLTIDFDVDLLFQPVQYNEKLFLSYRDALGNYKLTSYNTASKTLGPIVNFSSVPISILIDDVGDLAVVKNGVEATLERYDTDSLSFLSSTALNFNSGFVAGPISGAVLSEEKLYYAKPFVQPARFSAGPAIFDIVTQENTIIDLPGIADNIEEELGASILITSQRFSKAEAVFLISYAVNSEEIKGGVLEISSAGNLVNNVTFPFLPTNILKD